MAYTIGHVTHMHMQFSTWTYLHFRHHTRHALFSMSLFLDQHENLESGGYHEESDFGSWIHARHRKCRSATHTTYCMFYI